MTLIGHLVIIYGTKGGGLEESQRGGGPPYTWKKFQCLKLIFRPFGAKKIKNKKLRMTPADPHPLHPTVELSTFFNPFLMVHTKRNASLFSFSILRLNKEFFQSFQSTIKDLANIWIVLVATLINMKRWAWCRPRNALTVMSTIN